MGKIFCVMGKSASGKDTIYNKILQDDSLMLSRIIPYTTRPIRDGETQDKDYHFCNEEDVKRLSAQGRIIELREYNTVLPIYVEVEDGDRLIRAIHREKGQQVPKYEEMCRRFLADASDFSEEKLHEAGITRRFVNDDMDTVLAEISAYIRQSS